MYTSSSLTFYYSQHLENKIIVTTSYALGKHYVQNVATAQSLEECKMLYLDVAQEMAAKLNSGCGCMGLFVVVCQPRRELLPPLMTIII